MKVLLTGIGIAAIAVTTSFAQTVKIAYPNWAEGIAMTNLMKAVIEDRLGFDVELTQADPGVIYASLAGGDQDLFVDAWLPFTHESYWERYGDDLVNFGPVYGFGVTGLVVPEYMSVESIEDLNGIAEELDGKIIGIDPGAGISTSTLKAIDEYGLDLEQVDSSGPAMTAALSNAIEKKEPIVVTGWKPHWMFGRFELKILADPLGIYPIDQIRKIARKGFAEDEPELRALLINFSLTEAQLLDLSEAIEEGDDPLDSAEDWMLRNEPLIDSWLGRS